MSVLTKKIILSELQKGRDRDGLIITPLSAEQIGPSSVDLHLGNEFIIFRRVSIKSIDVLDSKELVKNVHKYQEKVRINKNDEFILHTGQLVLGSTQEYVALPNNLSAIICGRSTWVEPD